MKKTLGLILSCAFLAVNTFASWAGEVILTSDDVVSAPDIEHAIDVATNFGAEPGLVLLDGSYGDFFYTGGDKSINIGARSEFELRGINDATLANCDDGIFFDEPNVHNINITGITFVCNGNGIREGSPTAVKVNVVIKDNVFDVAGNGMLATNTMNLIIKNNYFRAPGGLGAIGLSNAINAKIIKNTIEGSVGVLLDSPMNIHLTNNEITSDRIGIALNGFAIKNKVTANTVSVIYSPALVLGPSTYKNRIHGNKFNTLDDGQAIINLGTDNKINGNQIR